ncbi:MAG: hypothetical protein ACLQD8_07230 [Thermoplasmata archaeon]
MHRRLIILGIAVALLGVALWYFPIQTTTTGPVTGSGTSNVVGLYAPLDVFGGSVPFTLHWQSHFTMTVKVYSCGDSPGCKNVLPSNYLTGGSGTSGTLHWHGTAGEYFAIISTSEPLTYTLVYPEPVLGGTAGAGATVFGGFLIVLGVWLPPPVRRVRPGKREDGSGRDPF